MRFGKISANEFFNTVDFNGDGEISLNEFVEFWEIVKGSGHTEEEIREEVRITSLKNVNGFVVNKDQERGAMGRVRQPAGVILEPQGQTFDVKIIRPGRRS